MKFLEKPNYDIYVKNAFEINCGWIKCKKFRKNRKI